MKKFIFCLFALVITVACSKKAPQETSIRDTVKEYLVSLEPNKMPHIKMSVLDKTERVKSILAAVSKYRNINNETELVWSYASKSAWATMIDSNKATVLIPGSGTLIVIIPSELNLQFPSTDNFYDPSNNALYLLSTGQEPDAWIAQIFFHEYGHSIQDQVEHMEDGLLREVLMHTLSTEILNTGVKGYKEKIREISTRTKGTYEDVLAAMTKDDLYELDKLIFGKSPDRLIARTSVFQHLVAISFCFADNKSLGIKEKKEIYGWLESVSYNN